MENQDIETMREDLIPSDEEEENLSDSPPSLEVEDLSELISTDSSEELSPPPPSPIDGDMKSLPLSEEIKKQKSSKTQTKKLVIAGVVGIILLLVLFKVFKGVGGNSSVARDLGLIKDKAEKKRASIEIAGEGQSKKTLNSLFVDGEPGDYFLAGIDYHNEGKVNEAIKAFEIGIEKDPELKEIGYNNQGVIHAENGKYKKAIRYFKEALKINPRYADAHYNLASAYEKIRNEQKALFHYQRFIELAEKDYSGLTMLVKQHLGRK